MRKTFHAAGRRAGVVVSSSFVFGLASMPAARAASPGDRAVPNSVIEQRQAQQQDANRQRAMERPDALSPISGAAIASTQGPLILPPEIPCFPIQRVEWKGAEAFPWLVAEADILVSQCAGATGLQKIRDYFAARLVSEGYVTTRVLIPEQNLSTGLLQLHVVAGRIGEVKADQSVGWWRTALPTGPGGLLNQRDLDQATENVRRLQGQADAMIDLVPGAHTGDADLVLKPGSGKRWHGSISADNGGIDNTGKYQLGGSLTLDSPLFLYDSLTLSGNTNANFGNGAAGTRSSSASYNVPLGYWSLFVNASQSRYKQTVAGFVDDIVYGGSNRQMEAGVGYVAFRNAAARTSLFGKLYRKVANSTINDRDLSVQHRDLVGFEIGASHRHYVGASVVDIGTSWRQALPSHSRATGVVLGQPEWDGRSQILMANAALTLPFTAAAQRLRYQGSMRMQYASTRILPSDYFVIGNRYAVRGFDEQLTLSAENGVAMRNDLAWKIGDSGQEAFVGFDMGHVSGPSAEFLVGRTLMGAVVGARGRWRLGGLAGLTYELTLGTPVKKPANFRTRRPNIAAQVALEL
ncbi:MAG: ShlB/FhaC/HecB family hemolysin secretion/activation protein [Cupriavidus sp.]|nr:ShlB/FhaC/HecB family hemolysin secretion/activation protein [Cupriavidus sp.]QWE97800.1 ShlB/FhaC/HecB family hemolysin secretion/activation protein [Cupriavidus sp. EM10]MCA3198575.1 ShlB/FhaC/HecB family hemolysin secretion/activation protein [Cupriavidus sp.]MCA3201321.1 ShlB/FhaC/HecB family hemolysin secretion/activation protein [Cupriavidus sp.]MCA3209801.1 ShlB/FhaC/HecB family hemolysin secretion/activation protein [Cupriavidus sp.]